MEKYVSLYMSLLSGSRALWWLWWEKLVVGKVPCWLP